MDYTQLPEAVTRAAIQAIIDRLVGDPRVRPTPPDNIPEPYRTVYLRVKRAASGQDASIAIGRATHDLPDGRHLCDLIHEVLPPYTAFSGYRSLLETTAYHAPVDWLWPSWIPYGLLTILGAAPGAGKSLLALDLARRIIHDLDFPDGAPIPPVNCPGPPPPGAKHRVIIVDAEGTLNLLDQRARAWNIDRHRLIPMLPSPPHEPINLANPRHQEQLTDMADTIQPTLLIVDSLAAVSSSGEASLEAARELLGFLAGLADRFLLALLLIHHLRKRPYSSQRLPARPVADDLRGSSHLSAAARSVLALSVATMRDGEPDPNGPRRLEVVKTNLCANPAPVYLHLEGDRIGVPALRYTSALDVPAPPLTQVERCAQWLLDHLANQAPSRPCDVVSAAEATGFSRRTLYRARGTLRSAVADLGRSAHDPNNRWFIVDDHGAPNDPGASAQ